MRRLSCAFVVRIWHKQAFSWQSHKVITCLSDWQLRRYLTGFVFVYVHIIMSFFFLSDTPLSSFFAIPSNIFLYKLEQGYNRSFVFLSSFRLLVCCCCFCCCCCGWWKGERVQYHNSLTKKEPLQRGSISSNKRMTPFLSSTKSAYSMCFENKLRAKTYTKYLF